MAQTFSVEAFIFVIILVFYVITSHVIELRTIPYIHQSTVAIFMGIVTAAIAKYALQQEIQFNNQIFFAIILPPIIFSAGYSLRKSLFFQNFGMVAFLGIIGTIIGFICLTAFLFFINFYIFQAFTFAQVLMISSVMCATDTVAAMSLIKPQKYPVLNAVLFGEGIINDAVAIILFGTISKMNMDQSGAQFSTKIISEMFFDFCYLFFFSMAFGVFTGFGLSYLFKVYDSFNKYPIKQTSLILLNGYFTYLFGQLIGLSGIITLFTCAIIMGHYCFMNISQQSQKGTGLAFQTVSYISQAFVFAYLGASILSIDTKGIAIVMAIVILLALPFIRAIMVCMMPLLYRLLGRPFPMNSKQLKMCWYSGMIRGVIAFALCLQIQSKNQESITTVALVIVMVTTVLGSSFLKTFAKKIGMRQVKDQMISQELIQKDKLMSSKIPASGYKNIGSQNQNPNLIKSFQNSEGQDKSKSQQVSNSMNSSKAFKRFEDKYIRPIFQKKSQKQIQLSYQMSQQEKYQQNYQNNQNNEQNQKNLRKDSLQNEQNKQITKPVIDINI